MSKPTTSYTPAAKPTTAFTGVAKNTTTFDRTQGSTSSILLNDAVVRLNSIVVLLSGYIGATPNQLSNKNATAYTAA